MNTSHGTWINEEKVKDFFKKRALRKKFFKDSLSPGEDIDPLLLEDYQLSQFNQLEAGIIKESDLQSPLGFLASGFSSIQPNFCHLTEEVFETYEWKDVFGYTLEEVKNLPFDEWHRLMKVLKERREVKHKNLDKEKEQKRRESDTYRILLLLEECLPVLLRQNLLFEGKKIKIGGKK